MARLTMPSNRNMSAEQARVCAETVAGQRGKIPTPMIAWLQNAQLAQRAQGLGETLRFETSLSKRQSELAILACARHWSCDHIWASHSRHALAAGIIPAALNELADGHFHPSLDTSECLVVETVTTLLKFHRLDDALYMKAEGGLGRAGVVELVALVGYYGLVALTVNAFELGGGS